MFTPLVPEANAKIPCLLPTMVLAVALSWTIDIWPLLPPLGETALIALSPALPAEISAPWRRMLPPDDPAVSDCSPKITPVQVTSPVPVQEPVALILM